MWIAHKSFPNLADEHDSTAAPHQFNTIVVWGPFVWDPSPLRAAT